MPKIPFSASAMEEKRRKAVGGVTMDESTKESISDLLGIGKKKAPSRTSRPSATPYRYEESYSARMERERREDVLELDREVKERRAKERAEILDGRLKHIEELAKRCADQLEICSSQVLLEMSVAVSVDTSKACVVINSMGFCSNELASALRTQFTSTQVKYCTIKRVWEVHPSVMPQIKLLLKMHFKDIQVVGVPKAVPSTKFDQLLSKLDKDDKAKMYKLLALKYHTDRGGNHDTMVLVNQVFKEV
jgi:hypothetical protein